MKKEYLKPASTVVAVAPVKLLEGSPTPPVVPIDPREETDETS